MSLSVRAHSERGSAPRSEPIRFVRVVVEKSAVLSNAVLVCAKGRSAQVQEEFPGREVIEVTKLPRQGCLQLAYVSVHCDSDFEVLEQEVQRSFLSSGSCDLVVYAGTGIGQDLRDVLLSFLREGLLTGFGLSD